MAVPKISICCLVLFKYIKIIFIWIILHDYIKYYITLHDAIGSPPFHIFRFITIIIFPIFIQVVLSRFISPPGLSRQTRLQQNGTWILQTHFEVNLDLLNSILNLF